MTYINSIYIAVVTLFVSGASGIILTFMSSRALIIVFYGLFIVMTGLNVSLINGAAVEIFPTHLRYLLFDKKHFEKKIIENWYFFQSNGDMRFNVIWTSRNRRFD